MKRSRKSTKKSKPLIAPEPRSVKVLRVSFWSGVRKPRVLLRADLLLTDESDGRSTTLITIVDSKAKNVVAMVERVHVIVNKKP